MPIAFRAHGRPICSVLKLRKRHKGRRCLSDCDACRRPDRCPFQAATSARPVSTGSFVTDYAMSCARKRGLPALLPETLDGIGFLLFPRAVL
jgi:hypothetical protein